MGLAQVRFFEYEKDGHFEMVERRFDATGTVGHDVVTGALSVAPGSNLSV